MAITVTAVRDILVGGSKVAAGATASVSEALARDLVWRGDATATLPSDPVNATPGILITKDQIIGVSLGAADSGGTGFKVLRVANSVT